MTIQALEVNFYGARAGLEQAADLSTLPVNLFWITTANKVLADLVKCWKFSFHPPTMTE